MITATFREYNECQIIRDFEKEFESEREMFEWIRLQLGHPFLTIGLLDWTV